MNNDIRLNIIFPVLNEHLRLERGITTSVAYLRDLCEKRGDLLGKGSYRLTIVDNGSDDDTPLIGKSLAEKYGEVEYVRIEERGVGIAFRTGVEHTISDIVGYMDIDLSTDLSYLEKTLELFRKRPELEYVNASRFHKESDTKGRKWYRKIISSVLVLLLKTVFGMRSTDAICGFTFLRRDVAVSLTQECSDEKGWFYMIEFLLRAERRGIRIYDMPVSWSEDYDTTVNIKKTVINYLKNIIKLKKAFAKEKGEKC